MRFYGVGAARTPAQPPMHTPKATLHPTNAYGNDYKNNYKFKSAKILKSQLTIIQAADAAWHPA